MAILGTNTVVKVQASLSAAVSVTALSKAAEGVVTAANTFAAGDLVVFAGITAGMVELEGQACRIKTVSGTGFTLEGLDTSAYSTWAGSLACCYKVATTNTMSNAQDVSMPNPAPAKIDITTLSDKSRQYTYGLPDAPDGTINGLFNAAGAAELDLKAATKANSPRVFSITFGGGQVVVFNANVSGGSGFSLAQNQAATSTMNFTPIKDVMFYAS